MIFERLSIINKIIRILLSQHGAPPLPPVVLYSTSLAGPTRFGRCIEFNPRARNHALFVDEPGRSRAPPSSSMSARKSTYFMYYTTNILTQIGLPSRNHTSQSAMALASALAPLASASDAQVRAFLNGPDLPKLLPSLDDFFSRVCALQSNKTEQDVSDESRAVFFSYLRLSTRAELLKLGVSTQLLHPTRLVPLCQLFAAKNGPAVQQLLDSVVVHVPEFRSTLKVLRGLYAQQYEELHAAVQSVKRGQVVELLHRCYELSLSVAGLASSLSVADSLLLNGRQMEVELTLSSGSVLNALVQCYEADLPKLQRQLETFDEKVELQEQPVVAETRHTLLVALGRCVDAVMEKQQQTDSTGEELLAGLHALSNGCQEEEAEHGSFLSDLWFLCEYKEKVDAFFERCKLDRENFSYLDMVIEELPRRRILPTMLADELATESKPIAALSADAKEWKAPESTSPLAETKPAAALSDDTETVLKPMVHQVKDFFPDLGEGYVELCLLSSGLQVEVVINFLLESNPPPVLIDVPQNLQRTDAEFVRLEAQITGKPTPAAQSSRDETKKLDPSRVWVGKKTQEKVYDPQVAKKDKELAEKMKLIAIMYAEEDEYGALPAGGSTRDDDNDGVVALDEYDDDYNDEFEDYVPFSVRDGGSADDQDAIREQNRRMRAKEEKDAFWEGMKNRNRENPVNGRGEEDDDEEEKEDPNAGDQKPSSRPNPQPNASGSNGPKHKSTRRKDKRQGTEGKSDEPMTPQQQQRMRARKDKNKAKIANHNRKDRALKKMG